MENRRPSRNANLLSVNPAGMRSHRLRTLHSVALFILMALPSASLAAIKLKTVVDANIYAGPAISGQPLLKVPANKILEAEGKSGKFYKVIRGPDANTITGYIHENVVEEVSEEDLRTAGGPDDKPGAQSDLEAEVGSSIEESKNLITQGKDLAKANESLRLLIPKILNIEEPQKRKARACDLYYWLGIALEKQGEVNQAVREFQNMFAVDPVIAKDITQNVPDSIVSSLIANAENRQKGKSILYQLDINTEPKGATVIVNGQVIGLSPCPYTTTEPKVVIEVVKEGFEKAQESFIMTETTAKRTYPLRGVGRTVLIKSIPPGGRVFLDGQDTGKVTDCELPCVSYASHTIGVKLDNHADWEMPLLIGEGSGPVPVSVEMTANNYVFFQAKGGLENKLFKLPKAIAFDKSGNIYVADEGDPKIRKFDPDFRPIANWGNAGDAFSDLKTPAGLAVDAQGFFYVTDYKQSCVLKYDKVGKLLKKWSGETLKDGGLKTPGGIAVDRNNDIIVADTYNYRVVKFSNMGAVKKAWGRSGTANGEFTLPTAVAVNSKNEIIVADRGGRIQKFTTDGEFLSRFEVHGPGETELKEPRGLGLDRGDNLYLADTGNDRVLKIAPDGRLVAQWGGGGAGKGQFAGPVGIAVNDRGAVFVVDKENLRVQEFRVPSKTP